MKILIVRLSALGDIVHALPVLAAIKTAKPDAQVDWLVEENYASILSIASGLQSPRDRARAAELRNTGGDCRSAGGSATCARRATCERSDTTSRSICRG